MINVPHLYLIIVLCNPTYNIYKNKHPTNVIFSDILHFLILKLSQKLLAFHILEFALIFYVHKSYENPDLFFNQVYIWVFLE